MMNKYAAHHANDTNRVINSNVNKSGANITAGFTRASKKGAPQTQRNGTSHESNRNVGRNTTKHSVNATQSHITQQSMMQTQQPIVKMSTVNKMQMSVVAKATGDNGDKENRQRLSNR